MPNRSPVSRPVIDGSYWLPYLLLFCVFHAPAGLWLGSLRWVVVGRPTTG
ncbi:rhomboid-like protein [Nocardia donostiensis]|nr:rhomboid-like protein [Nocardia donostiensis]